MAVLWCEVCKKHVPYYLTLNPKSTSLVKACRVCLDKEREQDNLEREAPKKSKKK